MQLLDLPAPEVIEVFDFESIKARKLARVLELMSAKGIDYVPSESDDLMTMIEADSYEEMLLRTRINNAVKAQLLAFSKGSDLDHIGTTRYGILRLEGAKPYALFTFSLSQALTHNVVLPKGLQLSDGNGMIALLLSDATIAAGDTTVVAKAELQTYTESSKVKTEVITTPLAYIATAVQNENFHSGANAEDNERYRERIWLSREHKSTAGSIATYIYYAKTADARIKDVQIINDTPGEVKVYLLSDAGEADAVMIERVSEALNKEEVRPLTDLVLVNSATVVDIAVNADIVLYDLTYEAQVRELISDEFKANTMIFNKSLSMAKLYGLIESDQVKDVSITAPTGSVNIAANEVIRVALTLNFSGAAL